jgi:hypothetical protein
VTKKRGIMDPWLTVEPLHKAPTPMPSPKDRIDPSEIDFDADLAIPDNQTIRSAHVCFAVSSVGMKTPSDALNVLAHCIAELYNDRVVGTALTTAGIGVRISDGMWNVPSENAPAGVLQGRDAVIWFIQKTVDQGMLILARILRAPTAIPVLRRYGITIMLTAR